MSVIEASTVIGCPVEEVFAYVSDMAKTPEWSAELVDVAEVSPGPTGVGTTTKSTVKILGRELETTSKIVAFEPNRRFSLEHDAGPVTIHDDWFLFESVEGGTKVTHRADIEAAGFFKLAAPVAARLARGQWELNFSTLKEILEARAANTA